jgi:WD40 repeat protein
MAFSPDGKTLAVSARDGLRLLSVGEKGERVLASPSIDQIESLVFSPDGGLIITASRQGVLCWNLAKDEEPQRLEDFPQGAGVVRFSPEGGLLAVGNYHSPATLFDVASRKPLLSIASDGEGHSTEGMCFTADGKQLVIPSSYGAIEFFDVKTGKLVKSIEAQPIQPQGVAVSPQGEFLASIGTATAIEVWDLKSGKRISDQWIGNLDAAVQTLFTLNDEQVITGGRDGSIRFWNAATGQQERMVEIDHWVVALALSPRGESLLSLGLDDTVRLWDAATGTEKRKLPGHGMTGGSGTSALAFSPDGKQFYSFGMDLVLRINETATGKVLAEHNIRPSDVKIESGPDGRPLPDFDDPFAEGRGGFEFDQVLLTAGGAHLLIGGRTTSKIYIFDGETGRETAIVKTENPLQGLAVSPDGSLIATFEDDSSPSPQRQPGPRRRSSTLRLRDMASQKIVREVSLPGGSAYRMAFSNDGKLLSFVTSQIDVKTYSQRTRLSVLNVETLKEVAGMDVEPNSIRTMAFAHGGTLLGTGYADSSVLLWDLEKLRDNGGLPR